MNDRHASMFVKVWPENSLSRLHITYKFVCLGFLFYFFTNWKQRSVSLKELLQTFWKCNRKQRHASNVAALVDVFPATWNAAVVWYVIMMNQLCLQFVQAQGSRVLYQDPSHQHQLNTCPERVSVCVCVHSYFCSLNTAAVCCHTVCTVYSCRSCCFLVRLVSSGTWFACQTPVGVCGSVSCVLCDELL